MTTAFLGLFFRACFIQYFNAILCVHGAYFCQKVTGGYQTSGQLASSLYNISIYAIAFLLHSEFFHFPFRMAQWLQDG